MIARTSQGERQRSDLSSPALALTIITPHRGWFDWRLRQLWRYRDLVGLFVWRDFVAIYKQTILGPTWHIIRPLLTAVTFTVVFGRVAGLPTDGAPLRHVPRQCLEDVRHQGFLFYMAGVGAWTY